MSNLATLDSAQIETELTRNFLLRYPADAALKIEALTPTEVLPYLTPQSAEVLIPVWNKLVPSIAARYTLLLPQPLATRILSDMPPNNAVRILTQMPPGKRQEQLDLLSPGISQELTQLMSYPEGTAGRLMDTRIPTYRGTMLAGETLDSLRETGMKTVRALFITETDGRILGRVLLQDLALAQPSAHLASLAQPVKATVQPVASQEEIGELFKRFSLLDLPVVDLDGVMLGVIMHTSLLQTMQENSSADIQTMVGVSREERALSAPLFAVKKRMPWLQVNLLTAFLAAAVVGIFENTIAQFTALAILLPVVAGQSGNAGAQALAVTMRGLALREITVRHWVRVMFKEVRVGFLNGLSIALTCGIGVYFWSGSIGLVAVISMSMVLAMIAAGFAGAVVPILLVRLGQDPAQSSSIILTTVTDVAGFFSFLGIATLLMRFL